MSPPNKPNAVHSARVMIVVARWNRSPMYLKSLLLAGTRLAFLTTVAGAAAGGRLLRGGFGLATCGTPMTSLGIPPPNDQCRTTPMSKSAERRQKALGPK